MIGLAGDQVTVYGQDLGTGGSGSQLTFGGVQAPISTWFDTGFRIDANAPENMSPGRVGVIAIVNGQNSNGIPFRIVTEDELQAPIIESISPRETTVGSYITVAGRRFGQDPGYVYLAPNTNTECSQSNPECLMLNVDLPAACGDTWNGEQIIAQIPSSAGVGERIVMVENENGLQNSPAAADILNIVSGGAMPGICAISPTSGSAPLPEDDQELDITGINFSASPMIYFWGMNSVVNNNSTWLSANGSPVIVDGLQIINARFPVDPVSGFSMQTGPIKVRTSGGQESNSVAYFVDNCTQIPESRWPTGMRCCTEGSAAGVFISDDNVCPGEERTGGYVWRFTTGKIPKLPRVVELCDEISMPSPTPWQNWEDGENACLNRVVSVDFNMEMNTPSFAGNVRMLTCGSDEEPDCEEGIDISGEIVPVYNSGEPGGTLVIKEGVLSPDTWYHIELLEGILANEWVEILGTPELTNPPLLRTRSCGDGTAYCFDFKTGPAGSECVLTSAGIKPPQFTVNYLGPVLNSNTNLSLNYKIWGKGDQACSVLSVEGLGWNWITDLPASALITSPVLGSDILATAEVLQEPPGNLVEITASTVYNSNLLSADSDLFIELGVPRIVEFWPNCVEACVNGSIGARFSRQMDDRNNFENYQNGIHLYQCSNENTCINAAANFNETGLLILAGLTDVPFTVLEEPLSDRNNARVAPNNILSPNTSYLVYFDNTILSVGQVDIDGNIVRNGPALEPKVWRFKTREDGTLCIGDEIKIRPDPFSAHSVGEKTRYISVPFTDPDLCNADGQELNPWDFGWAWSVADTNVAQISHFASAGKVKDNCNFGCLPAGSDVKSENDIPKLCGNGIVDPGEDCDVAVSGEVVDYSCSIECLRPGNEGGSCGNNIVEPNLGEECDIGPTSATRVNCSSKCVHLGSTADPNEAILGAPLCGDRVVTVGEDCEGGVDGETSGTYGITYNDSDLRGLWHFNELSGLIIDSAADNNGSQFGGVAYGAPGKFGSALGFDGVDDYISVSDSIGLRIADDITVSAWVNPDFDAGPIEILIVEGAVTDAWVTEFESLGYDVTVDTGITTVAQVDAINPDIVACIQTAWACGKGDLYNDLYSSGHVLFTEGNDSFTNIRPITAVFQISDQAGQIVPEGTHPINNGWTTTFNSGGDGRQGILSIHNNAYSIAVDDMLGYVEAIYLEESGSGRWFHLQPGGTADPTLVENAVNYLTRDEIAGKGDAYNLFLNNQTLSGFINNRLVSADINAGWNQVVLSYDGAIQNLYVNGVLRRSSSFIDSISTSSVGLSMGRGFSGSIDEVQVWNKVLSQSEVSDLYNASSETDVSTVDSGNASMVAAGLTCSANCLHTGAKLSQGWCDDNSTWSGNAQCLEAISVCGNEIIESGEECELIGGSVYVFNVSNPLGGGIATNAPASSCSASCLLQDICGTNIPASLLCVPSGEGCNADCTLKGSSVEGYSESSLCGDAEVGIGEYSWCEWSDLLAFNTPGENPIQAVTAIGLGTVNPATLSQSTEIQSVMVSIREMGGNSQIDLTPEQRTQLTDTADYSLQCGYKEFYDTAQSGLVSSWSAEGNADDGQGVNNCVLMNGAGFVDGSLVDSAFSFDGIDDYLFCGTDPSLNITNAITMEAWFNVAEPASSLPHRVLIANRDTANYVSLRSGGQPFMSLRVNGTQRTIYSNFSPQANTWYHVAGTFDGSMLRIYVNGILRGSSGPYPGVISNNNANTYIGKYINNTYYLNGTLDEIKIYNRALSPAEITANYNISSKGNFNYCPTNGDGVGYNSCCYPRPERVDEYPADGVELIAGEGVCRNSNIFVTFNGDIDAATLTNNLVLALGYSTTTPADVLCNSLGLKDVTSLVDETLAYNDSVGISPANGFWQNIWQGIKRLFAWFVEKVNASITNDANIDVWCDSGLARVPGVAKITDANGVVQETVATISINRLLNSDSTYAVFIRGGKSGIKDTRGVGIGNPDRETDLHDSFLFHTSDQLCKMESVSIEPPSFIFVAPAVAHPFTAYVKSTNGQFISPITGVYDWTWNWAPSSDPVFAIPTDGAPGDQAVISISSKDIEGSRIATARATIISDLDTVNSQIDQVFSGDTELMSVFCANPWPPREYYPLEEGISFGSILNDDGTDGAGVFDGSALLTVGGNYFNFKIAYCADAGVETSRSDDLPYLKPFIFTSGLPDSTNLKRFLFFNDINNDAIGVQVFSNPDHDSASEWFSRRYGSPVGFSSITIDGYSGITDGNNYYISALNEASPDSIYYNIYLFSINEDAQESTKQVFNKLIDSLEFNINLSDYRYCEDDPDILCGTDFDCLDDLGLPLVEGGTGVCSADKTKMLRDWERLQVIRDIQDKIYLMSKPPEMKAGTYLPGQTRSIWPSWGNLSNAIGGVGVDPINNWTSCGYCHIPGGPIDAVERLCSFDSDCVAGSGEICVSVDSQTCWDSVNSRFICPNKASVLGYRIANDGNYMLYGPLEHFADVSNFVSTTHFDIASACAPGVTEVPVVGACGNDIVNLGEQCDPPGSVRHNSVACIVDDMASIEVERCSNLCQWEVIGCESPFICGNARVETGEICDDGSRNGTYGNCNSACTGFSPQYCGNSIRDFNTLGNPLELCDLGPLNGVYGQGCSYDCQGLGLRCGDGILQPDTVEECDDGNNSNTDSCSNACIKLVSTLEEIEETAGICGNNKIDSGEVCDKGTKNGIQCAPTYGEYCNYCSYDCKKVLYVEPTEYCGNQELDVMEMDIEGNNLYESCEYTPEVCTGIGCFGPFILFNPNTSLPIGQRRVEVDGCRQKYNYNQTGGINLYTTYTGIYKCKNQCTKYENACNLCGHATFDQGGVKPRVTILSPLSGNEYFWPDYWNANLYARFYFRYSDSVTASGSARLVHDLDEENADHEKQPLIQPEDIFRNAYTTPRGILANLACNDVYFLCFSRDNLSATPNNSCLSYDLPSEFLWSYEVNGEAGTIDNEYVLSPPVPE